ncbi:MAG: GlsB/YeaQ/YmgE family stress response membrane protein, partial [Caulobacteraceae bacterium]
VLGLVSGFVASKLVNRSGDGILMDIILGVIGALVGGWISVRIFAGPPVNGLNLTSFLIAIVGAVIVLLIYHTVVGRRRI